MTEYSSASSTQSRDWSPPGPGYAEALLPERPDRARGLRLAALIVVAYVGATMAVWPDARRSPLELTLLHPLFRVLMSVGVMPPVLAAMLYRIRLGGPAATSWPEALRRTWADGWLTHRLFHYFIVALLLPLFFWCFAAWKSHIPPFTWDVTLAEWDRALHGTDPWRLLPLRPLLTVPLEGAYWSWRLLFLGLVAWQGWTGTAHEKGRFWLAFVLTWILLGTVLASLIPSAGPCYYLFVAHSPRYVSLLTYLGEVDRAHGTELLDLQRGLWAATAQGRIVWGAGVSAFPSLHVALPVLATCAAWRRFRPLAWAFALFSAVILIGSVHTGWHYAVDGYASLVLVPMIWWLAGRLATPHVRIEPREVITEGASNPTRST
jgi:PAP2 superfamily